MLRRLIWLEFRQARPIVVGLTLSGIGFIVLFAFSPLGQLIDAFTLLLVGLAAAVCGAACFQTEGAVVNNRFLADRGTSPGAFWLAKQLVWSGGTAVAIVVLTTAGSLLFGGPRPGAIWALYRTYPDILLLSGAVALNFYAAAQWVSSLCRRGLESLLLGLCAGIALVVVTLALRGVLGLDGWNVRLWGLLLGVPTPVLLLALSLLRTDDWLLGRKTRPARQRYAANCAVPLVIAPLALVTWRAFEVPDIGSPFPVEEILGDAATDEENAAPLYLRAVAMLSPEPKPAHRPEDEAILRKGASQVEERQDDDWHRWVMQNQRVLPLLQEAAAKRRCLFTTPVEMNLRRRHDPTELVPLFRLLQFDGQRLEEQGDPAAALDRYLTALRVVDHLCDRGGTLEFFPAMTAYQQTFASLDRWMSHVEQTPELLHRAIGALQREPDPSGYLVGVIQIEHLLFERSRRMYYDPRDSSTLVRWWCELPWERMRERRVRNLATRAGLAAARAEGAERQYDVVQTAPWRHALSDLPSFRAGDPPRELTGAAMQYYLATTPIARRAPIAATRSFLQMVDYARALKRAALYKLALLAYRRERGDWPDRLEQLIGDYLESLPWDPFSSPSDGKQPFLYRISRGDRLLLDRKVYEADPGEPILYSRGLNQMDDRGRIDSRDGRLRGSDFVFLLPRD